MVTTKEAKKILFPVHSEDFERLEIALDALDLALTSLRQKNVEVKEILGKPTRIIPREQLRLTRELAELQMVLKSLESAWLQGVPITAKAFDEFLAVEKMKKRRAEGQRIPGVPRFMQVELLTRQLKSSQEPIKTTHQKRLETSEDFRKRIEREEHDKRP